MIRESVIASIAITIRHRLDEMNDLTKRGKRLAASITPLTITPTFPFQIGLAFVSYG